MCGTRLGLKVSAVGDGLGGRWFARRNANINDVMAVVIITSNPQCNVELMQGCKENGMHAFGPLWDS